MLPQTVPDTNADVVSPNAEMLSQMSTAISGAVAQQMAIVNEAMIISLGRNVSG